MNVQKERVAHTTFTLQCAGRLSWTYGNDVVRANPYNSQMADTCPLVAKLIVGVHIIAGSANCFEVTQGRDTLSTPLKVFLIHGSPWNAGRMPSIACWNTFFLFSLKEFALFPLEMCPLRHPYIHTRPDTHQNRERYLSCIIDIICSCRTKIDFF
ncbi:hypothetical protein RJT34_30865 [Clitoria ternatea]|uniref:Uncharacterized protein n=1 Tax=Clitoria ternatea TaxID=43366 RepID=A0AAN9EU75_CLITE